MNWTTWVRDVQPSVRGVVSENVQAWFKENRLERDRVGLVGESMFPWAFWDKTLRSLPDVVWNSATRDFNEIQKRKSPREMELMRKVCAITNEGMRAGVEAVTSGFTEGEVVGEIARQFYRQGAHELAFSHTIASGPRGGLKHSYPTERKIREGDLVYIDIGARYYGYNTDMSRVVVVGKPNTKQRELLDLDRDSYYTLLDMIRPGVPVAEIHGKALEMEERSGFYERYGEGTYIQLSAGHAMSTGFAEWTLEDGVTVLEPDLSPLAFEPMITMLDFGTIVIESMVAVTEKGNEVLTPLEVDWMIGG
jgi:Xaa-Pro aminopeptidase